MKYIIVKTVVGDRSAYQRALGEHLEYLRRLQRRSVLVEAGNFDDRSGGMMLVECAGLEQAIAIAREDPLVVAGLERYQVHGFQVALGDDQGLKVATTPPIKPVDTSPLLAPPPEEDNFKVVGVKHHPQRDELMTRCLAPGEIGEDDPIRLGYLRLAGHCGLDKLLLLHDDQVAGQIEFAPPEASGLPLKGEGLMVVHCLWVLDAFTGLEGGPRLLAACAARPEVQSLATVAYNHNLPWMSCGFFERQGFIALDQVETGRFFEDTPIVAYLMWRPVTPDAEQPTWDRDALLSGVDFCPGYPWMFGKRIYWGQRYSHRAVLVREGLRRPEVLQQLPVLGKHRTDNWTIVEVGVPGEDLHRATELIQSSLIDEPTYFCHLYRDDEVIIIFPDRVFNATADPASWKEAIKYGVDKGVPREELIFAPLSEQKLAPADD